jgi:RHS repeat-associated protein
MKHLLTFITCLLVSHVALAEDRSGVRPEVLSLPSGPGSIEGLGSSFDPNPNTGSAGYQVAIDVPPGVGGFVPDIALRYSSGAGNGELGIGWTLGMPSVERSTEHGLPRYDDRDVLVLRGMGGGSEELVKLTDGSYRFRVEGAFVRGRQRQDGSWEFRNRSGVRFRFGQAGAVLADGERVFAWYLTEQEDTFGNRIRFAYESDATGRPYLASVLYNEFGSVYVNEVAFVWEERPDALTSYLSGFPVTTAQRLARVVVRHGGDSIRTYELTYEELVGLSRLKSARLIGRDGKTSLPPVTFGYAPFAPDSDSVVEMSAGPTRLIGMDGELTDVDGDALPDVLITDPTSDGGRYRWYPNLDGRGFGAARVMETSPSIWFSNPAVELADMDGNGEADIVTKVSSTSDAFRFYPSVGGAFLGAVQIKADTSFTASPTDVRLVDLNHDRLTDWLHIEPSSGIASVSLNEGAGKFGYARRIGRLDPNEVLSFARGLQLADMNGDGLSDLVAVRSESVRVWWGLGSAGFNAAEKLSDAPELTPQEEVGLQLRDLNGDGLSDIVFVGANETRFWLNLAGAGFGTTESLPSPPHSAGATVRLADMNGNGTTDIVWIDPESTSSWQYQDALPAGTPGLLTRIENGLGKVVSIEYAGMGQMRAWEGSSRYERVSRNPIAQMVISAVTVSDGLGNEQRTEYRYSGGFYHPFEREFRGFALAEVRAVGGSAQPTLVTSHLFDLGLEDDALKGMELGSERRAEDGYLFDRTKHLLALRDIEVAADGTKVRYAFVRQTETLVFEGAAEPRILRTEWDHDDFGNVVLEQAHGEVCGDDTRCGDDEKTTHRTYAINTGTWIVDRVATERVESVSGERVAETRTFYDGVPFTGLELGEVTRGGVSRVETWIDGKRFASSERIERDEYGNSVTSLNARGGKRQVNYDDETHTIVVAESLFPDEETQISWHVMKFDRGLGTVLSVTGPNGDVTEFEHDALGRPSAIIEPGDTHELPTRSFAYELGSPLSTVRDEQREKSGESGTIISISRFDGLGRARGTVSEGANGEQWVHTGLVEYGPRGWESLRALPGFGTQEAEPSDWRRRASTLEYDAAGRELLARASDGAETRTKYQPLARTVADPNDLDPGSPHHDTPTTYYNDGLGRLRQVIEREGDRKIVTARYDYDALGSLTRMEDAAGRVRSYRYDGRSSLVRIDDPNAGLWKQEYSDAGDLLRRTDPTGRTVRYVHDPLGRPLEEWHTLPGEKELRTVTFHYDQPSESHADLSNVLGRLAWVEDAAGAVFHGYSDRGLLTTRVRRWEDGSEHSTWTDFDTADRPTRRGYPDSTFIEYSYDQRGLLSSAGPVARNATYTASGELASIELGNGTTERRYFDDRDRLTRLDAKRGDATLRSLELSLDSASRVTAIIDHARPKDDALSLSATYTFDDRYRLSAVRDSLGITTWTHDDVANILSVSSDHADAFLNVTNRYGEGDAGPDQITHHGDVAIAYDAAGRVLDDGERKLSWDAKGRLARVERRGLVEEYVYGQDDERAVKRTTRGERTEVTRYVDADVEERGGALSRYVFVGKERVARLDGSKGKATPASASCSAGSTSSSGAWLWLAVCAVLVALRWFPRSALRGAAGLFLGGIVSCSPSSDLRAQARAIESVPADATFYLVDHHNTPLVVLDAQGTVVEERAQHVYGAERAPASSSEPWSFAGNELDASELGNFHARPYDARLGRFLAVDPEPLFAPSAASPVAFQAYSYASADPVNQEDPSGRSIWTKLIKVGVKIVKTGNAVEAFADNVKDAVTLFNPAASPMDRVIAGVSLASELLPVSVGDAKDAGRLLGVVADAEKNLEKVSQIAPTRGRLKALANEIREGGVHAPARNQRTIAVGEDAQGVLWAGSSNGFDKGQRAAADRLGVQRVPSRKGAHAEENLLREVPELKRAGTSKRAPCGAGEHNCAAQLERAGVEIDND